MKRPRAVANVVAGWCPMGCGRTLMLSGIGQVTCWRRGCPRPTAVAELLNDREIEHLVHFGPDSYNVQHPLRERLDGALLRCEVLDELRALDRPPVPPGRYRVTQDGTGGWDYQAVAEERQ